MTRWSYMQELHYNKETEVAHVDVCRLEPTGRIDVIDVTQTLDVKTQVLARLDAQGNLLGLVIQDYPSFKREMRRKYFVLIVERILDLLVSRVREYTTREQADTHHR